MRIPIASPWPSGRATLVAGTTLVILLAATLALAQADAELGFDPEQEAYRLARELMSPFCPGRTLADCPSGKATELRADIRASLEQGIPPAEVVRELELRYGPEIRGAPDERWPWVVPAVVVVVALVGLAIIVRVLVARGTRGAAAVPEGSAPGAEPPGTPGGVDDDLAAELDRELDLRT